jgi:hypothetical protein
MFIPGSELVSQGMHSLDPKFLQARNRKTGQLQMFWGGLRYEYRSDLMLMVGDPESVRGGINSHFYLALPQENLFTVMYYDKTFLYDNDPVHKACIVQNWLEEEDIRVLDWPPYPPDLNPIKKLWFLLKEGILKKRPVLNTMPKNE